MNTQIIADLVKYFAIALFTQIGALLVIAALTYIWFLYAPQPALTFIGFAFFLYYWPYFFMGILAIPVAPVLYSFLFAVIKVRLQDRAPR